MGRFLCLHGMGCNGKILRWQIAPLIRALGTQNEFIFADGEVECAAAHGIEGVAPPPFLCYFETPSTQEMQMAFEYIEEIIETDGPFDGVIGFSQGSALAASVLLNHALNGDGRPPFNFAIFYSGGLPFSPDGKLYEDMILQFIAEMEAGGTRSESSTPPLLDDSETSTPRSSISDGNGPSFLTKMLESASEMRALIDPSLNKTKNGRSMAAAFEADPLSELSCRPFYPAWTDARITIPTLHVFGTMDIFAPQAQVVYELCDPSERNLVEHGGGHDVPRDDKALAATLSAAIRTVERSKLAAGGMI